MKDDQRIRKLQLYYIKSHIIVKIRNYENGRLIIRWPRINTRSLKWNLTIKKHYCKKIKESIY